MLRRVIRIECDICGAVSDYSCYDKEKISQMEEAALLQGGWLKIGKKHVCPDCYTYNPDTDNYEIMEEEI